MSKKPTAQRGSRAGATPQDSRQAKIQAAQKASGSSANKITVAGIVAILAIIAVVGGVIWNQKNNEKEAGSGNTAPPAGATVDAGYRSFADVTLVAGAPVVTVFEDFQCPACKQYEAAMGSTLAQLAKDGKIDLRYHIMNFLDDKTGAKQSTPVANGAFCAADQGKFQEFHDAAYTAQYPEGRSVTTADVSKFATTAGVGDMDTWTKCVDAGKYTSYINASNESAGTAGVTGTPTLKIGDKLYSGETLGEVATADGLTKVVEAATK